MPLFTCFAIAHAANVDLSLRDFNTIQERVPHLADLKPSGQYVFQDLYEVGGVPAVMKYLWQMVSFMATASHVLVRQSLKTWLTLQTLHQAKKSLCHLKIQNVQTVRLSS